MFLALMVVNSGVVVTVVLLTGKQCLAAVILNAVVV